MTADGDGPDVGPDSVTDPSAEPGPSAPARRGSAARGVLVAAAVAVLLVVGVAAVRAAGGPVQEAAGGAPGASPAGSEPGSANPEPAAPDRSPGASTGSTDDPDKATSAPAATASDLPAVDPSATGGGSSGSRGFPDGPCPGDESPVHLPSSVTSADQVVAAFICAREVRTGLDGGTVTFEVIRKVSSGLPKLLESYSVADKPIGAGPCPAIAYLVTPVRLQVGGSVVVVRPPLGTCAMPEVGATEALKLLGMSVVSEKRVSS